MRLCTIAEPLTTCLWCVALLLVGVLWPGIKPVYVFEGKPPELKLAQLKQRRERREDATEGLAAAKEAGDTEAIEKYSKRTTKVRRLTSSSASQ